MWFERADWRLVVALGWLVIFALIVLVASRIESSRFDLSVALLAFTWYLLSLVTLPFYYYRAWRRVVTIPNDWVHIAWTSVETLFVVVVLAGMTVLFFAPS